VETLDRIMLEMIERRRADSAAAERTDLLGILLAAVDEEGDGGGLSAKEVRDELVTLFLAGHETTSHALTWTLYLLSRNPGATRLLHAELERVLGGRTPSYEDAAQLVYTEQVLKEAMRIYPPAYTVARRAIEDTSIGRWPVQRGSEVILWIYMTHHDERWYPQPSAFWPDRFTEEEEAKRPPLAYLPFGAGPRACIGKVFAMLEAKLILATLAQRLRFELTPGQRVEVSPRITLSPKHGMRMKIRARGSWR
jgi:cytochrome P450